MYVLVFLQRVEITSSVKVLVSSSSKQHPAIFVCPLIHIRTVINWSEISPIIIPLFMDKNRGSVYEKHYISVIVRLNQEISRINPLKSRLSPLRVFLAGENHKVRQPLKQFIIEFLSIYLYRVRHLTFFFPTSAYFVNGNT